MADQYKNIRAYRVGWLLAITDWLTILPVLKWFERKTTTSVKLAYLGDRKQIEQDLQALEPKDRIAMLERLMQYVLPKQQAIKAEIGNLTDAELSEVADQVLNQVHNDGSDED